METTKMTTVTTITTTEASPRALKGKTLSVECTRGLGDTNPRYAFTVYNREGEPTDGAKNPVIAASAMLPGTWMFNESFTALIPANSSAKIQLEGSAPLELPYGQNAEDELPEFVAQLGARIIEAAHAIEREYPVIAITIAYKF
jgi:hypothetical protein